MEKIVISVQSNAKKISIVVLVLLVVGGVIAGDYYWYSRKQASPTAQNNEVQQFEESDAAAIVCPQVVPTISCDAGYQVNIVPQTSVRCSYAECAPGGRAWPTAVNYGAQSNTAQNEKDPNVIYPTATTAEMHFSKEGPGGKFDIYFSVGDNTGWASVPTNLLKVVKLNSLANDINPFVTRNGLTIYFSSDRSTGNYDLYYATRTSVGGAWGTPVSMGVVFNTTQPEWSMTMNDAKTLIFFSRGTTPHLYYSKYVSGKWTTPVKWERSKVAPEDYPELSADGKNLYFAAKDTAGGQYYPSSKGGYDIYVSEYKNNAWQTPVNLGSTVNTTNDEIGPFVAAGQDALFFSRNGTPGFGGFDIYYSIPARINGGCGSSHNGYFSAAAPPSANLCAWGTASTVTSQGDKWTWTCAGSSGGLTASCQALPRLDVFFVMHGHAQPEDVPLTSATYSIYKDAIKKIAETLKKHGMKGDLQFANRLAKDAMTYEGGSNFIKGLASEHSIGAHNDAWERMPSPTSCNDLCGGSVGTPCSAPYCGNYVGAFGSTRDASGNIVCSAGTACQVRQGGIEDTLANVKTASGLSTLKSLSFKSHIPIAAANRSLSFSRAEAIGALVLNDDENPGGEQGATWGRPSLAVCDNYSDFGNGDNVWYKETGNFLHPWRPNYARVVNGIQQGNICGNNPAGKVLYVDQVTGDWLWKADSASGATPKDPPGSTSVHYTLEDSDFDILKRYFAGALAHLSTNQLNTWGWPQHPGEYLQNARTMDSEKYPYSQSAIDALDRFLTELDVYKGKTNNGQVRYVTLEDIYNDYVAWQKISGK